MNIPELLSLFAHEGIYLHVESDSLHLVCKRGVPRHFEDIARKHKPAIVAGRKSEQMA